MKSTTVTSMSAGLLLIALIGQVGSFKFVKQPAGYGQPVGPYGSGPAAAAQLAQQEEAIQREQLEQQRQIALLQQQQQQAEYQIYQQQLEAERFLKQHQSRQESTSGASAGGVKGYTPITYPSPPPRPQQPGSDAPYRPIESQSQFAPPHSTIAYLVVRPPYPTQLPYDESPFRGYLPPLTRPQAYSEYPRRQTSFEASSIKGERQEDTSAPQQQPPPPPPPAAVVVPVHGDKHGKLRAMLEKLMSKLSFSSYEVTGEEYVYPPAPGLVPPRPPQEPQPVVQPTLAPPQPQAPVQQQTLEQEQIRDEAEEVQQPIQQQQIVPQKQQEQQQQQQQQLSVEQERDEGFDDAPIKAPAASTAKPIEQTKQEIKDEFIVQQQQQLQEQDFNRQPAAPIKGGLQQQQQQQQQQQLLPIRQPEPQFQSQRQDDSIKASRKGYAAQQQQQQQQILYPQQETIRQEQKGY